MKFLKKIYQEADILLFYAYIWQIPFAWRFILIPNRGTGVSFNEYMDISLYIGEIILFIAYIFKKHKNNEKSIINKKNNKAGLFHVKQVVIFISINLLLFNILFSIDQILSIVSALHLLFVFLAGHMLYQYFVSRGTKVFMEIGKILLLSLMFQLGIAFLQLHSEHSLGLKWLSESVISLNEIGIAKSNIFGQIVLRGYGTFPHPNVFAAYALFVLTYFLFVSNLFHVKQDKLFKAATLSILSVIAAQSKLLIFLVTSVLLFQLSNLFHVKQSKIKIERKIVVVILVAVFAVINSLYFSDIQKSYSTRLDQLLLQNQYQEMSFFGSGVGTYRLSYDSPTFSTDQWLLEPVHNMLYILFNEMGVGISVIILIVITNLCRIVPRGTIMESWYIILPLFFIVSTDHYGWDIYQGQQIVGLILTLLFIKLEYLTNSNKIYILNNHKIPQIH